MALGEACHSPRPRKGTCLGHTEHMTRPPRRPQAPGAQAFAPYSSKYFRRDFKPVGHSRRPPGRPLRPTGPHEICLQAGARKFQKPKAAVRSDSTAVTAPGRAACTSPQASPPDPRPRLFRPWEMWGGSPDEPPPGKKKQGPAGRRPLAHTGLAARPPLRLALWAHQAEPPTQLSQLGVQRQNWGPRLPPQI